MSATPAGFTAAGTAATGAVRLDLRKLLEAPVLHASQPMHASLAKQAAALAGGSSSSSSGSGGEPVLGGAQGLADLCLALEGLARAISAAAFTLTPSAAALPLVALAQLECLRVLLPGAVAAAVSSKSIEGGALQANRSVPPFFASLLESSKQQSKRVAPPSHHAGWREGSLLRWAARAADAPLYASVAAPTPVPLGVGEAVAACPGVFYWL